jgi:dynein heavy chain
MELRRKVFITPTYFIDFIATFNRLIREFQQRNDVLISRYENGVQKIVKTEREIQTMREELSVLQEQLEEAKRINHNIMQELSI